MKPGFSAPQPMGKQKLHLNGHRVMKICGIRSRYKAGDPRIARPEALSGILKSKNAKRKRIWWRRASCPSFSIDGLGRGGIFIRKFGGKLAHRGRGGHFFAKKCPQDDSSPYPASIITCFSCMTSLNFFGSPMILPITFTGDAGTISPGELMGVWPKKMQKAVPCGQ